MERKRYIVKDVKSNTFDRNNCETISIYSMGNKYKIFTHIQNL